MKRRLITAGLLLVILASFGFVGLKLGAAGPDDNFFNRQMRQSFAQSPFFRQILGLHYDGDGRADYLGRRFNRIHIEIKAEAGAEVDSEVWDRLAAKIKAITGKTVSYEVSSTLITHADARGKSLTELMNFYRKREARGEQAALFVLVLGLQPNNPDQLGSTVNEDGIVIYAKALEDFTQRSPRTTLAAYLFSTLLHEFGHQLGLPHNQLAHCLMNERAERKSGFLELARDVVTDFCPEEYAQLKAIKAVIH